MEVIIQPDPHSVAKVAARLFQDQLDRKANSVLGLATGSTPLGLYKELAHLGRANIGPCKIP